jgi:hypothetical protein
MNKIKNENEINSKASDILPFHISHCVLSIITSTLVALLYFLACNLSSLFKYKSIYIKDHGDLKCNTLTITFHPTSDIHGISQMSAISYHNNSQQQGQYSSDSHFKEGLLSLSILFSFNYKACISRPIRYIRHGRCSGTCKPPTAI